MEIDKITRYSPSPQTSQWSFEPIKETESKPIVDENGYYTDQFDLSTDLRDRALASVPSTPILDEPVFNPVDLPDALDELERHKHKSEDVYFYSGMLTQKDLRETTSLFTYDSIKRYQESIKLIAKEFFNQLDDTIEKSKTSQTLNWVGIGFGVLLAGLCIASIIATVATSGTALPVVLAVGSGVVGAVSGSTTIAGAVLKQETNQLYGNLDAKKLQRTVSTKKIKKSFEEVKKSEEAVHDGRKQMADLLQRQNEAVIARL